MRNDVFDWIGLSAITIALHGLHHGFEPVYLAMSLRLP
jgi:hypothetical protein